MQTIAQASLAVCLESIPTRIATKAGIIAQYGGNHVSLGLEEWATLPLGTINNGKDYGN
jgi:hypothetical protein